MRLWGEGEERQRGVQGVPGSFFNWAPAMRSSCIPRDEATGFVPRRVIHFQMAGKH